MANTPQFRRDPPHRGGGLRTSKVTTAVGKKPIAVAARPSSLPATRIVLLTILLSSVMVFSASRMGPVWSAMLRERVAARELAELESLENQQLSAKFDAWLARGKDGLQWTVTALTNQRPGVSYFAEQALLRESDTWRIRPRTEAAERIVQIAKTLAQIAEQLPAARRPGVRRLVERFAVWPIDDAIAARELTAACDAIIAHLPPESADELQLALNEEAAERRVARAIEPTPPELEAPLPTIIDRNPSELQPPENLPPPEPEGPPLPPKRAVPKRFFAPRATELPPLATNSPNNPGLPLEPPQKNLHDWVHDLADLEVMRLLHHGDYGVRYTAEKELDRRGYATEHLPLAKQLVHPDPSERRKLAEQLPRLTNVDPRPWLLQLAEDEDPSVRRTAAGILQAARPGRDQR
jgi:hypothetical protein